MCKEDTKTMTRSRNTMPAASGPSSTSTGEGNIAWSIRPCPSSSSWSIVPARTPAAKSVTASAFFYRSRIAFSQRSCASRAYCCLIGESMASPCCFFRSHCWHARKAEQLLETISAHEGGTVLGWRDVHATARSWAKVPEPACRRFASASSAPAKACPNRSCIRAAAVCDPPAVRKELSRTRM